MYYDPKLTTTAIVEQDLKVLFVKRATPPGIGLWSLPGGYVDRGEIVEEAASIVDEMRDRNVLLSTDGPHHNVIKIKPPMVLSKEDVDATLHLLNESLNQSL